MSDEIRDQINDIIEGEIQNNINEYLESEKEKEDSGLGFANNEGSQLNVKVSNAEIDKIVKKYKKIQKYRKSSLFAVQSMDETEDMINKMVDEIMKDDSE
jgi:DNA mismatch repair ATPase MutS